MMRKSCDDLPSLDMSNDLVILISGIASTRGGDNAIEMGPELYWDAEEDERKAEGLLRLLDTSVSTFDLIPGSNDNTCAFVKDGSSLHFMNAPRNIFGRDRAASAPEEFEANARSPLLKVANQPSDYGSIPLSTSISEGANQSILAPAFQRGLSTGTQVSIESSGARRRSLSSTTPPAVTSLRSSRDNRASTSIKYESLRDASKKFAFKNTLSVVRQQMQMYLKGATSSAYQNINEATGTDPTSTGVNKVNPQNISNISPWRVVNSKNDPGVDDDSRDDESFNSILCDESEIATDDGSLSASVHKKQTHDQLSGTDIAISDKQKLNSLNVNPSRTHDILGQESGRIRLSESALKRIPSMQRFEQMNKSLREGLKGTIASSR